MRSARERLPAPRRSPRCRPTRRPCSSSMGLTSAQVSQIQTDQQALATAIAADPNQPTTTSTSSSTSPGDAPVGFAVSGGFAGRLELRHAGYRDRHGPRRRPALDARGGFGMVAAARAEGS